MLPMEFDHRKLSSLPVPTEEGTTGILRILYSMVAGPIMAYFRNNKGTDPIHYARVKENITIVRNEDEDNRIRNISLITRVEHKWTIKIHERIFDYLVFVIPTRTEPRIVERANQERRMLAFSEFILRHQIEHILYPERKERDVIASDLEYAMHKRATDPTFYQMLRSALQDDMNGIRGDLYIELFDSEEQNNPCDCIIKRIVHRHVDSLVELPAPMLTQIFPLLDTNIKTRVLGECYRRSQSSSYTLVQKSSFLQTFLKLFTMLTSKDENEGARVFNAFKDRWGLTVLFQELNIPEGVADDEEDNRGLFDLFMRSLQELPEEFLREPSAKPTARDSQAAQAPSQNTRQSPKSLKDRIEEARSDPAVPRQVIEIMDKNKANAAGQSGAKYNELIENLLAIPWGKISKIDVSTAEFEEGLNRTHYGLQKPKDVICDFFSNLIWRYREFKQENAASWRHTGSAFLFVGPPGVGKTSFAISIATNLGIPYHKVSLAGMRDEADIKGYGFTYEGSKPGAIVQGLMKMGVMNGMFILDEADKTEKFAIATLLEILDPEQNHLFHDKYTQTTVDIDLSNCHFVLTANTLETVPPAVVNRCEVIYLDRYSVEEKIAITRGHLINRIREKYRIGEDSIFFEVDRESELLRHLIRNYTFEAGVREVERIVRKLFLRIQRKEIIEKAKRSIAIQWEDIKEHLGDQDRPKQINDEDRVGEMMALGVNVEAGMGSVIPIQVTRVRMGRDSGNGRKGSMSIVHATGNIERVMDESRKVATTGIFHCAGELGIDLERMDDPVHIHFMGGSTKKDGPSAGGAIGLALASLLLDRKIRRDVAMTGEIDTQGRITGIGALDLKLETAYAAGCRTMIIPVENLHGNGGIERFPDALKQELQILTYEQWKKPHEPFDYTRHILQVIAVDDIVQAADIAFIDDGELDALERLSGEHAEEAAGSLVNGGAGPVRRLRIVYVRNPAELDMRLFTPHIRKGEYALALLVEKEAEESVNRKLSQTGAPVDLRVIRPNRESVLAALRGITASAPGCPSIPLRVSLEAPLEFLERYNVHTDIDSSGGSTEGPRSFANDCTLRKISIHGCRQFISRLNHYLARIDERHLNSCPFLVERNGIHAVDLFFIPEKYRLDPRRCEEILNRCLQRWMSTFEAALPDVEDDILLQPPPFGSPQAVR